MEPKTLQVDQVDPFHKSLDDSNSQSRRKLSESQISSYEAKIAHLTHELEKNRKEKELYIQRIEEIIDHIINQNEQNEESRISTEDEELGAINCLKHELNTAQQRVEEQKRNLTEDFEHQKAELIREYEDKIKFIQQSNEEKLKGYTETIDVIERNIKNQTE